MDLKGKDALVGRFFRCWVARWKGVRPAGIGRRVLLSAGQVLFSMGGYGGEAAGVISTEELCNVLRPERSRFVRQGETGKDKTDSFEMARRDGSDTTSCASAGMETTKV